MITKPLSAAPLQPPSDGKSRRDPARVLSSWRANAGPWGPWQGYLFAVVATAVVLGLRLSLEGSLRGQPALVIFTLSIMLSAYIGGLGAGLLATLLSFLAATWFLLQPLHSFRIESVAERWNQLFVVVTGVVISAVSEALHRARRRADDAAQDYRRADERVRWLASFPEQNPHPVAEFDRTSGALRYANLAALTAIPELKEQELRHPALAGVRELVVKMENGGTAGCEVAIGEMWYILTLASLAGTPWIRVYGSDITERKRAEFALQASEELFEKSFRLSPDCVVVTRASDRTVVQANDALCQLWERTPEQVIGQPAVEYTKWVHEEERENFVKTLFETGERLNCETELCMAGGRRLDFNVSSRMITFRGESCILSVLRDITERRRIEAAAARLAAIVESSDDAIIGKDLFGIVTSWNHGAEMIFGYSAEEMVGQPITRLIPEERLVEEEQILARLKTGESTRSLDTVRRRKDGSLIDISVTVSPIKDLSGRIIGASKLARDITQRTRALEALRDSEQKLRESETYFRFLHDLGEATRRLSDPADIMAVMARLLGGKLHASRCAYAEVEADGEQFTILHDYTDGCASTVGQYRLSLFGPRAAEAMRSGQTLILCDVDRELPLGEGADMFKAIDIRAIIVCPLVKEGALRAMMAVHQTTPRAWKPAEIVMVQDVVERCWSTLERRIAEEKIQRLNAELEHRVSERTAQLEAANKELEAFSYSVSHDLRSPLRAVDGFSQAVMEDYGAQLPEEGQRYLATIRSGAQRMGALIDDLLTFSRLSRLPLTRQTVDAGRQVREVLDELKPTHDGRSVEIRLGELPPYRGDPALIKQVWVNLISNALKYTNKRAQAVVEISAGRDRSSRVYSVRDNGTGFDMRYVHKLFGVFQRLHRAEEYEGTGVGLAIVQRVVHRHGGRVWAEAAVDQGATFYFTLEEKENQ